MVLFRCDLSVQDSGKKRKVRIVNFLTGFARPHPAQAQKCPRTPLFAAAGAFFSRFHGFCSGGGSAPLSGPKPAQRARLDELPEELPDEPPEEPLTELPDELPAPDEAGAGELSGPVRDEELPPVLPGPLMSPEEPLLPGLAVLSGREEPGWLLGTLALPEEPGREAPEEEGLVFWLRQPASARQRLSASSKAAMRGIKRFIAQNAPFQKSKPPAPQARPWPERSHEPDAAMGRRGASRS